MRLCVKSQYYHSNKLIDADSNQMTSNRLNFICKNVGHIQRYEKDWIEHHQTFEHPGPFTNGLNPAHLLQLEYALIRWLPEE